MALALVAVLTVQTTCVAASPEPDRLSQLEPDAELALMQTFVEAWIENSKPNRTLGLLEGWRSSQGGVLPWILGWSRYLYPESNEGSDQSKEHLWQLPLGSPGDVYGAAQEPRELPGAADDGYRRLAFMRPAIMSKIVRTKTEAEVEAEAETIADQFAGIPVFVSRRRRSTTPRTLQVRGNIAKVQDKKRPMAGRQNATLSQEGMQGKQVFASKQEQVAILGICVGIPCLSFLAVLCVTVSAYQRTKSYRMEPSVATAGGRPAKPIPEARFFQLYVFGSDMNRTFAKTAELSFRAAFVVALCATCFWTPSLLWITQQGWSLQHAVVVFSFTWAAKTGDTVQFSWQSYIGITSGIFYGVCLFAVFPDGVTELNSRLSLPYAFGAFLIMCLVFTMLNWYPLCRLWALYLQAYFTMSFINPQGSIHIAHSFREVAFKDGLVAPLVGTIIGSAISMFTSLVPYPLLAFGSAQDKAIEIAWELGHQWDHMVSYYAGDSASLEAEVIAGAASRLNRSLTELDDSVQCAWWECFDLGRPGRARVQLLRLTRTYWYLHDWLQAAAMAIQRKEIGGSQASALKAVWPHLDHLSVLTWQVLQHVARVAVSGDMLPSEEARLREEVAELEKAQVELAAAFGEEAKTGPQGLPTGALSDHAFALSIKSYSRGVAEYAMYLLEASAATKQGTSPSVRSGIVRFLRRSADGTSVSEAFSAGLATAWDLQVILTWDHIRNSLRIITCYALAFNVGRLGVPGILSDYSSTPAGCAIFIMNYDGTGGSAFVKKFTRFQGVAVGTLLGQLIFALLVRCSLVGVMMGFVGVLIFEFFAFYFYFSSEHFWYTGLLVATFGAGQVLTGCDGLADSPWQVYQALLDQVVAILCCMVADLLLAPPSPSQLAACAYHQTAELAHRALVQLLDPDADASVTLHRNVVFNKTKFAEARGEEAALEPRFMRTPWRHGLWQVLLQYAFKLARKLTIMEYVAASSIFIEEGDRDDGGHAQDHSAPRKTSIATLVRRPLVQKAIAVFLERRRLVFDLANELLLHETEVPLTSNRKDPVQQLLLGRKAIALVDPSQVVEQLKVTLAPATTCSEVAESREDADEVGTFLLMLELTTEDLDAIAEAIVQAPELSLDSMSRAPLRVPQPGLLRAVSGRLGDAPQTFKDSLKGLWGAINSVAADNGADTPPASPLPQEAWRQNF